MKLGLLKHEMDAKGLALVTVLSTLLLYQNAFAQVRHQAHKQGYSMRMWINNVGAMGRVAIPPFRPSPSPPTADSLGLEYPIGQKVEHLYGGGVWIGGIDGQGRRLTTVSYEGWAGPYYEMFPGTSPLDTLTALHVASRRDTIKPPGWDAYWGGSLPFRPISDRDIYYTYTDTAVTVTDHIPLRLKVIQSTYAWDDPYADAIIIIEYRVINMGTSAIDSAFIGFFFEADVGPIIAPQYWTRNFSEYLDEKKLGYIHNPYDVGSTPAGIAVLWPPQVWPTSRGDTLRLRYTFQWFPGPNTPPNDAAKYAMLSSGVVDSSEYPNVSDTRFVSAFGPFTMLPRTQHQYSDDTLKIAVAIVSGFSRQVDHRIFLQRNATRALDIYLNQGIKLPATPPSPPLRVKVGDRRVELNWQWEQNLLIDGKQWILPNPEANWDTTNQVARRDPMRSQATHLGWDGCDTCRAPFDSLRYGIKINPITGDTTGWDTTKGGRNFEAYRLWRSENPDAPDASYTLVRQFDVIENIDTVRFEYETGLQYTFVDSNLVRGKTYVYAVTSVSIPNLAKVITRDPITGVADTVFVPIDPLESAKGTNAKRVDLPFAVSQQFGKVLVVPNPYRTDKNYTLESGGYEGLSINWDENKRVVKFINLPEICTIRIFSLAGELVKTILHDGIATGVGGYSRGDHDVELLSESNRALASGIYIFTVESELGTQTGKFVIIR
jgi:hypothetical protein